VFVSFRVADFRYLALSTLAVGYGQWAQQIGLFWLVLQFTDSPAQLGFLAAFRGGVGIVVSPLGGILADRHSRRAIMIWSTLAGAVVAGFIVVMVIADLVEVWHLYVFALFGGILQSINMPTRQAFVYDVSTDETLSNAIAMNSIVQNVSRVSGPPLAGALIGFFGVAAPFVFIAVMHLVAVAVTLMISQRTRQVRIGSGGGMLLQMLEGFRYCWRDRRIMGLIVVTAIPSVLIVPYIPFMAVISEQVLGRGPEGFGLLASMLGWGSILGLFLLAFMGDIRRKGPGDARLRDHVRLARDRLRLVRGLLPVAGVPRRRVHLPLGRTCFGQHPHPVSRAERDAWARDERLADESRTPAARLSANGARGGPLRSPARPRDVHGRGIRELHCVHADLAIRASHVAS